MPSPFDLHVLSTPPAFILSQDQTLEYEKFICFANLLYYICFANRLPSFDPDQNKLGFFVSVLPKHLLFGLYLFDTLSENLCFSLEFSGLHYCLFVKVRCCVSVLVEHATVIYYHICRWPSIPFFEIFYKRSLTGFCPCKTQTTFRGRFL